MEARAATALLLVTVSVSLVFAAGRMSVWIVPVTGTPRAVADGQEKVKHPDAAPAKPALAMKSRAAPLSPGVIEAAIGDAKTSTDLATPSVVANSGETSGAVARTVADGVLRGVEVAARQIPPAPDQSVISPEPAVPKAPVALNAGADAFRTTDDRQPMAPGRQEPDRSADDTAGQCERRYSSFRRSDGTYQPFDGGPRKRCPLLR
jgi:BA14K-like protein